ncbi:autotransporter outer membrane beta-barrel domain-containing protein [Salmonella enterica]|uniref:Autotransporter outer membrane beta-barrel domain-containing protein n=10 Tax=Salmonella enterica TaxID=28901 RepID=A0A607SS48_SALER|nr:autotransporter outer membrane beta-barrel domain-containing protein [Salmonella enterica]ECS7571816.1 autotransporter outer membrane beta-barrel domain-containing protein [Salmonella enterica subsp. enterica serovar Mississippi]EAB4391896.1 autotransporter outer membrane beta-barrel domain-containing protein [Salmonella enterica]EAB4747025.1 autotransporter outer membrane beta-barrel domain-containing protein [Salmonella enterica]EAN1683359.1 autotransporter outer membrane beta-barrel domai
MNRTYSIVWSAVRNMYVVASELARSHSKVKIQAHANEVAPSIKKPDSGWARHHALALAIVAALGFASPLAIADNPVSYIDGVDHDLSADSPISYSGTGEGSALHLEGLPTQGQGWQPTSATGTNIEIGTDGGGAPLSSGSDAVATAVSLYRGATLELTDAKIYTKGNYTAGISLDEQSKIRLNGGNLEVEGNYGILMLYNNSQATLIGTEVTATAETTSSIVSQQGSTLNITDGSDITLTSGQLRVVGDTNGSAFLNVSDSTVSSTGANSTVVAANRGILDIKNSSVTHNNATGAAIEASSASTLNVFGDDKSQMSVNSKGVGVKGIASSVEINGATITADDDGILMTSQGKSSWYDDTNALTVNNADVTSKTAAALHVDSKTNINDPIELNNSTLTGPTAIKLESAVTVQATNSTTLDGNVDAGITASSLSLTNSSLQGSVNGVHSSLTLDADSQWTMTGSSALGSLTSNGEITLGDGSASAKTLQITNALTLQNDSQLNITLSATDSPVITTGSATLDGSLTLNLDSTAAFGDPTSDQQFKSITLIDSDNAISTNVDSLTTNIDTDSLPDYLTFGVDVDANDNTNFVLEQQLSWNANATSISEASGTFTLGDNETFEVTSELSKVSPVPGGWDGETLTKEGDGTLILSNTANDYGNTNINGGTLSANDAAALGSGDVVIAENATLALSQGTLDNNVTGEGQIVKSGSDELIVTGDNSYSGGTTITGGTLIADNADLLGTGAIANSGVLQVGEGELENTLSGSGSLVKTGSGELTLSGDNDYSGGTIISDGTLIADNADSLGTGAVANSGVLQVGEGELENTLSGSGSLVKTGSGELTLSGDNDYSGGTIISDGTLIAANVNALGGGDVDNAGTLKLDAEGEFNLANVTTQSGATTELAKGTTLNVDSLTQQADSTLNIDLSEANGESAITADSVTLGGTLNISGIGNVTDSWTPEAYTYTLIDSDSAITTDFNDLTVAGMNSEDVDFLTIDGKVDEADNTNYDLTASLSWYADRDNASTDAHGTFTLSDPDGNFNVAATLTDVDDTLDPGSTWDGKSLTKEGAGTLILSGDNDYSGGTTINEGTLVAASTTALGTGLVDNNATLVLDADSEVSAAGGITTHSGATTQLALGTSLDLGDSALIQEDGSTLNVELNSDLVQPLITGGSATLGGDLVVSDASLQARASDAEFQSFKLMDMDSDISGDFTSLTMNLTDKPDYLTVTGAINPQDQSEYLLTEGLSWNATATSATPAHGTFTLGAGDSFEVTSVLGDKTGNGDWDGKTLTKLGAGKLMLSGANTYTGDTNVQEGTLWLSGDGTIGEMGSQQAVNVASGATFGGSNGTTVNGKVTNEGMLVFGDSDETGAIFTLNGDLINMGTMTSGSSASTPGNTLYVDGNYTGNGGSLYLNTVLGDDDSATDKLVITGDASGTTELYINGIGDGAQTTNGIEVVDVGGVSTSDAFVLKNEVNASLYTYRLYWNESDNDWYLASKAQSDDDDSGGDVTPSDGGDDGGDVTPSDGGDDGGDVTPSDGGDDGGDVTPSDGGDDGGDVTPSDGGDDGGDVTPSDDGGDGGDVTPPDDGGDGGDVTPPNGGGDVAPQYRADIGAYMGNQWMARNLQMQTLYDREGSQYRNADGSVWARFKAGKAESEAVSGNIDMDSNYSQFQLGGDILAWGNGQQSITVGVMASYINADTDSTGNRGADGSQFTSSANVDGYNLGIYATWFADAKTHSGAYVDSWYQYGFYNNSVESGDAGSESYDSTANAVSLETGYRYDIALNNGNTVSLTPQTQVVWQNYSADSVKDNYGTRIDGQDGDSWTTRLGLRVDGKLYKGSRTVIQPFAEANWLHTSDDVSVSFDDATVKQDLPANRAELKVGLQADIDKQWSVRAQVAGQTGSNDFGDLNGSLNLRYNW